MDTQDRKAKYKVGDVLRVSVTNSNDDTLYRIVGIHGSISDYPYAGLTFSYDLATMESDPIPLEMIHEETINSMFTVLPYYDAHLKFDKELADLLAEEDDSETK